MIEAEKEKEMNHHPHQQHRSEQDETTNATLMSLREALASYKDRVSTISSYLDVTFNPLTQEQTICSYNLDEVSSYYNQLKAYANESVLSGFPSSLVNRLNEKKDWFLVLRSMNKTIHKHQLEYYPPSDIEHKEEHDYPPVRTEEEFQRRVLPLHRLLLSLHVHCPTFPSLSLFSFTSNMHVPMVSSSFVQSMHGKDQTSTWLAPFYLISVRSSSEIQLQRAMLRLNQVLEAEEPKHGRDMQSLKLCLERAKLVHAHSSMIEEATILCNV